MNDGLLAGALGFAILNWVAVYRINRRWIYITKPAVIGLLLVWLIASGGLGGHTRWFALGLFFTWIGDILLLLPKDRFIPGMMAFFIGHLCYIVGFNDTLPPANLPMLIMAVLVGLTGRRILNGITSGLKRSGQDHLRLPVLAYSGALTLMLLSALLTLVRAEWDTMPALIAASGALLFFVSDTLLAWNKYVQPMQNNRLIVMMTYHIGQVLIILSAVAHFLGVVPGN